MSVHKAITNHVKKQNSRITEFIRLDHERERYIDIAVQNCQAGKAFSVTEINAITGKMNELAKLGAVPQRKIVTAEMVEEYAEKLGTS
ncbi:YpbS family protein [Cytobacillus gottheilii]|uniref:YpbS family protein n=1 Tax=Cytobacillus gottheilii TaxID=859144 RepID=UPI00082B3068|nr:YpbS family protein [Cytobacillus gottheilii]